MDTRYVIGDAEGRLPITEGPLTGTTFANWLRLLSEYGPVDRQPLFLARAAFISAFTLVLSPFHGLESLLYDRKVRQVKLDQDPVFLLGFFRSGTTHLHRLMGLDPQMGCMDSAQSFSPATMFVAAGLFRRLVGLFMPSVRPHDNVTMSVDYPEEDEHAFANLSPYGLYHATYFPRSWQQILRKYALLEGLSDEERAAWDRAYHFVVQKTSLAAGGKRLLLKNPANLSRLRALVRLYPNAKFVFLYRNPYVLFESLRNFYVKEMREGSLQDIGEEELETRIVETYSLMMARYLEDCALIPEGNLVEVPFEAVEARPVEQVAGIYEALGLPGFAELEREMIPYLDSVKGYQKNRYRFDEKTVRTVDAHWHFAIDRWGYEAPGIAV